MFAGVSEHVAKLRLVKGAKLVFRTRMHYFGVPNCEASILVQCTNVPKMMFGSVSEHFANPRLVKEEKLVFRARMEYFGVPKL
jgi:hypothetical protein